MPESIPHADVLIVGAGFGGSLLALILKQLGKRVMLVDSQSHPRFAIGESSTPTADMVLRDLCNRYQLPQFLPLCRYGSWLATYPELQCGLKRGFSYFFHQPNLPFSSDSTHPLECVVAASASDHVADTHWLRADVDHFFVNEVQRAGIDYFDETVLTVTDHTDHRWHLHGSRNGDTFNFSSDVLLDASGGGRFLQTHFQFPDHSQELQTVSHSLYAHFRGVTRWESVLHQLELSTADYPCRADDAALHHVLKEGWMWQLRFRNQVTSCGLVLSGADTANEETPHQTWDRLLQRYPSILQQFANSELVAPQQGLQATGRMQRLCTQLVGANWAMLPSTAGFIDPLHSTGIAHTMCGVERLAEVFANHAPVSTGFVEGLQDYERKVMQEFELIDLLVAGCYRATCPQQFIAWTMLYFAAATTFETARGTSSPDSFLLANNPQFRQVVAEMFEKLQSLSPDQFERTLRERLAPFNSVGLCDPDCHNMYHHTVADKDQSK